MADSTTKTKADLLAELPLKTGAASRAEWERVPIQVLRDFVNLVGDGIQSLDIDLTAAQLNDMKDTNVELIPAPATGLAVVPVGIHMFLDHGGTDFVQGAATDQFALKYNGGAEIVEIGLAASFESFIEAAADEAFTVWFGEPVSLGGLTSIAATAVDLDNNGATDLTTGDGVMAVRIFFITVPMV